MRIATSSWEELSPWLCTIPALPNAFHGHALSRDAIDEEMTESGKELLDHFLLHRILEAPSGHVVAHVKPVHDTWLGVLFYPIRLILMLIPFVIKIAKHLFGLPIDPPTACFDVEYVPAADPVMTAQTHPLLLS